MSPLRTLGALGAAALLLAACSSGGEATPSSSSAPASSSAAATSAAPSDSASASASASASGPETLFASLCDEATPEQAALIEAAMKPDFRVSQLVDVRTDDDGKHAILGFVEGPGLAVLAQWTGTGLALEGLASADEFAAESSTAPEADLDDEFEQLLGATVQCYTTLFAPES